MILHGMIWRWIRSMFIDCPRTSAGEEYLYHLLRSPLIRKKNSTREQLIEEITKQEDKRYDLEMALCDLVRQCPDIRV